MTDYNAKFNAIEVTDELIAEHGITKEEHGIMLDIMGRTPNYTELGIFSVMWSEHCSYKSSRFWLKQLPTEGEQVIQGPGENAGVVDIGDGQAAVFKIESHNHPSFIEPYQGAATGVGGIMRDVFTMGARPIANMNALRFGSPEHPKTRHLLSGVVSGIGGYGNCMGVPTVGGETNFHKAYDTNILVNAMTVGLADSDKIFYSKASGIGNPVVYVGSKTGRDGIHGATMASAEFDDDSDAKRPTVQVGDPFTEKLLLEACLELMSTDAIVSIQDMGAAGLTSSSVEMADKGEVGIELHLDQVPMREEGMTPYELMLSESQERMLMVLKPGREDEARAIFEKWELDFAVVGKVTDTRELTMMWEGQQVGSIPVPPLVDASPMYERPWEETPQQDIIAASDVKAVDSLTELLKTIMGSPNMASRRWIWEQYDHLVMGNTIQAPGCDAAVVRLPETKKGIAISVDCTPRYCLADPKQGGKQAVAESWRNLTASGAKPLAITNNMNFGNPERPRIMGQFVGAVKGMSEAAIKFNYPVVSGNVSLYNETNGIGILPTPVIGGVGVIDDVSKAVSIDLKAEGEDLILIGETKGWLGNSVYLDTVEGREEGAPPPVYLDQELANGDFLRGLIDDGLVTASHDLSDGGLACAAADMAISGKMGAKLVQPASSDVPAHAYFFGEDQARYLISTKNAAVIIEKAQESGIPAEIIGKTGGSDLKLGEGDAISLAELREAFEGWMPEYMAVEL
ncbi:phosphoribosylformylglycinamidine synthase subunit PurL [Curvivirga aplysinae]|uniref:phosphoribosylformylglycinamidine synthase subunit PurL n=1 Tax=Curvivirga aplysinae TaxID=2529852 RepID=UPI0012BC5DF7|nr:phosphoribosylformylglycinamidine synthase subunit PurL [Curvivirga aplysinae]MTI09709.1 phosphoribosylformylglycinamidine synthase subunit PurL [Curvivirga aplysinae]